MLLNLPPELHQLVLLQVDPTVIYKYHSLSWYHQYLRVKYKSAYNIITKTYKKYKIYKILNDMSGVCTQLTLNSFHRCSGYYKRWQ